MSLNLADRFEQLPEMAGANHFARVFKGHDYVNSSDVAILELLPSVLTLAGSEEVAWQSIERMWKVRDPSLIEKIAIVKERNWVIVAWNPTDCSNLLSTAVPEKDVAQWMGQALLGLEAIHKAGLIHGDIKPASLLLDPNDTRIVRLAFSPGLYIGDLAIDRGADQMNQAPELLRSGFGDPGPQTDLYSLAFTMLQIAAGPDFTKAFASGGDTRAQWARWHGDPSKALPPASTIAPHLSESFASLLDMLLSKNVNARPATAEKCLRLLGALHPDAIKPRAESATPSGKDPSVIHKVEAVSKPKSSLSETCEALQPIPVRAESPKPPLATEARSTKIPTNAANAIPNKTANKAVVVFSSVVAVLVVAAAFWFLVLRDFIEKTPKAMFVVSIEPADANLTIDGKNVPLKAGSAKLLLTPGDHSLQVTKNGYDTVEEKLSVGLPSAEARALPERKIQLLESELALTVEMNPPDANLLVEGKLPKWTSTKSAEGNVEVLLMLRPREYSFTVQKEGYVSAILQKTVNRSTSKLKFDPLLIEFEIRVEPVDSMVVFANAKPVDGKKNVFAASPGKHQLKITHPDFEPANQEVNVSFDERSVDIVLKPVLVQFDMQLPSPDVQVSSEGKSLEPNARGKYELKPGEYTLAFSLGSKGAEGGAKGTWEQQIKVEANMLPVVVVLPDSIQTLMASENPGKVNPANSTKSQLKNVLVRLFPTNLSNIKLVLDGNPIELSNGETSIPYEELKSDRKAIEFRVLRDNRTEFEEFITRDSLEAQGEVAVINHSVALNDKERARRLWLFARTAVKSFPKESIDALDEALALDPSLAVAYRERAIAKNELDLISDAEEDVVKALNGLPNDYATLSIGGIVASKMYLKTTGAAEKANLSLARSRLNQAVERYPKRTSARVMRAQLSYWAGDKRSAEEDLIALLGLTREPDQLSYVKSQLGTIATDAGNIEAAIQLFNEAIEIRKAAEISTTVPQFNKAKAILEHARRVQKEDPNKARTFFELAKSELIVLDGRKDLTIPEFLAMLAEIEATLGNYQAAIRFYTDLINNGVVTPIILKNRAAAFDAIGDKKSAEGDRAKATQLQK